MRIRRRYVGWFIDWLVVCLIILGNNCNGFVIVSINLFMFAFFHFQDISCPEAVKLDDIDGAAVTSAFEAAKATFAATEAGSMEQADAQIEMDVNRAMGNAIGLTLV